MVNSATHMMWPLIVMEMCMLSTTVIIESKSSNLTENFCIHLGSHGMYDGELNYIPLLSLSIAVRTMLCTQPTRTIIVFQCSPQKGNSSHHLVAKEVDWGSLICLMELPWQTMVFFTFVISIIIMCNCFSSKHFVLYSQYTVDTDPLQLQYYSQCCNDIIFGTTLLHLLLQMTL